MTQIILLYYKYTPIKNPAQFMREQRSLCTRLHLKGRIIVAHEGINGTVSGTQEATDEYIATMQAMPQFSDMEFKLGNDDEPAFPKLSIKVRDEIVSLESPIPVDMQNAAPYIEIDEMHEVLKNNKDVVILDARNEYESRIGKFKNALALDIDNFRDFPEKSLKELEQLKDKEIITYCTGGIRCEKASAYLVQNGFKVRQLHGGIIKYIQKYKEGFDGHCYVFDKRISVKANDNIISICEYCDTKTARYINCKNNRCHRQLVCCENCDKNNKGYCPQESYFYAIKKFFTNLFRSHENSVSH